ncbi:MAG: hypothetical protein AAF393_05230 [Pseudomonadota bacterium]
MYRSRLLGAFAGLVVLGSAVLVEASALEMGTQNSMVVLQER